MSYNEHLAMIRRAMTEHHPYHDWHRVGGHVQCWCGLLRIGVIWPIPAKAAHKRRYQRRR